MRGVDIRELSGDAQAAARRNADAMLRDARERFGIAFDPNAYNFRFDSTGRVTSWFDPL